MHHRPGKDQGHLDGLSCLPLEAAPAKSEEADLLVQTLPSEEAAQQVTQELHRPTHMGGDTIRKLFRDRISFNNGKRICQEVAQSCVQ